MLTGITALAAFGGCTAARWYLNRSSRRETAYWKGRVRLKALWNEGAAFSLPIPAGSCPWPRRRPWGDCGSGGTGAPWGRGCCWAGD